MQTGDLGTALAVVGLGALVAFSQTSKHMLTGKLSTIIGLLTIPLGVAVLWRLALDFGWWTILVFLVVSLAVGAAHGIAARRAGVAAVYSLQAVIGSLAAICIAASWVLR